MLNIKKNIHCCTLLCPQLGTNLGYSSTKNPPNQLGDDVRPHHDELNASAEVDGDSERRVEVRATEEDRQYRWAEKCRLFCPF